MLYMNYGKVQIDFISNNWLHKNLNSKQNKTRHMYAA